MSNPSPVEYGSMTVADIMQQADRLADAVSSRDMGLLKDSAKLERQTLELMLEQHFGSTEPFATVHVDGSFVHVAYHTALPNAGEIPLYRAPQMAADATQDRSSYFLALEQFYDAWLSQCGERHIREQNEKRFAERVQELARKVQAAA